MFYGWAIVAVMAATGGLSMALGSLNFGLFIKPMGDDLGLGRAVFGWAQSLRQVTSALTAPLVGWLLDRFGARIMLAVAAAITGGALVALAVITDGWQLIALFALMGVVGMSGPGALVTSVPVTKWFVRQRGRALAYMSLGIPIGGLLFVPLTQVFIDAFGWRTAWALLGVLGAGSIVPLSLLFVRRQPEDMGLRPDGDPPRKPTPAQSAPGQPETSALTGSCPARAIPREEPAWTRADAVRSGTFWRLVFVFSIVQLASNSVGVHRIPSFMDRGMDPTLISYATALDAAAAGLSTFAMGLLTQRLPARFIGAAGFLLLAMASALTILADSHSLMFVSMITFGLGIGTMMLMQSFLWADYFGRRHLGSIRGTMMPIMLLIGGTGPPVAGYVRDSIGSYTPMWVASIVLMVVGAAVLAATPPPKALASTVEAPLAPLPIGQV
ncbi:MAG: MFS transporter [Chloroflexi bacterium]|nr:MFS transporter [Chloroflexota bacterium]